MADCRFADINTAAPRAQRIDVARYYGIGSEKPDWSRLPEGLAEGAAADTGRSETGKGISPKGGFDAQSERRQLVQYAG